MMRHTQFRPAKKLVFGDKPGTSQKRALLSDHLGTVRLNEDLRRSTRDLKLKEEREAINQMQSDLKNEEISNYEAKKKK
jgi:hypothetical protein